MQNQSTLPEKQELSENTKKTWQEPQLNSLSVDSGSTPAKYENGTFHFNS